MRPVLAIWLASIFTTSYGESINFQQTQLSINGHKLAVEVAQTEQQRARGLMHRQSLAADTGMLFIFEQEATPCFWMKDTHIPLSLAYISKQQTITQIIDLEPLSEQPKCANQPIKYALEVPRGWFGKHQIKEGDKVMETHQ